MSIRPLDLQPLVAKAPEVTRDIAAELQQGSVAQQAAVTDLEKRAEQQAKSVPQFEEAAEALIRERQGGGGQRRDGKKRSNGEAQGELTASTELDGSQPQARVGRNIDLRV